MTVDLTEPLPAIQPGVPAWDWVLFVGADRDYKGATLAHLVSVLAALTAEQRLEVWKRTILEIPGRDRLQFFSEVTASLILFHAERAEAEKSRADRAEERVRELEALRIPCDLCGRTWCGGCTKHKDSFARGVSMTVAEFAASFGKVEYP